MCRRFFFRNGFYLRYKVTTILTVVISPTLNAWKLTRPVTMTSFNRRSPLERVGIVRVHRLHLTSFPNAVKEIDYEKHLKTKVMMAAIVMNLFSSAKWLKVSNVSNLK